MTEELIQAAHEMWFKHKTKWFDQIRHIPYLKELKEVLWEDSVVPYLNSEKITRHMMKSSSEEVLPEYRQDNLTFITQVTKNLLITQERSYQIYLDPTDPLHERECRNNGHIRIRYVTAAKRTYALKNLI